MVKDGFKFINPDVLAPGQFLLFLKDFYESGGSSEVLLTVDGFRGGGGRGGCVSGKDIKGESNVSRRRRLASSQSWLIKGKPVWGERLYNL